MTKYQPNNHTFINITNSKCTQTENNPKYVLSRIFTIEPFIAHID